MVGGNSHIFVYKREHDNTQLYTTNALAYTLMYVQPLVKLLTVTLYYITLTERERERERERESERERVRERERERERERVHPFA